MVDNEKIKEQYKTDLEIILTLVSSPLGDTNNCTILNPITVKIVSHTGLNLIRANCQAWNRIKSFFLFLPLSCPCPAAARFNDWTQ